MTDSSFCMGISDYRQRDAIDLLIDVEGVDIRHAADIVHDSHQPRFEVIAMDVVLTAEPLDVSMIL